MIIFWEWVVKIYNGLFTKSPSYRRSIPQKINIITVIFFQNKQRNFRHIQFWCMPITFRLHFNVLSDFVFKISSALLGMYMYLELALHVFHDVIIPVCNIILKVDESYFWQSQAEVLFLNLQRFQPLTNKKHIPNQEIVYFISKCVLLSTGANSLKIYFCSSYWEYTNNNRKAWDSFLFF